MFYFSCLCLDSSGDGDEGAPIFEYDENEEAVLLGLSIRQTCYSRYPSLFIRISPFLNFLPSHEMKLTDATTSPEPPTSSPNSSLTTVEKVFISLGVIGGILLLVLVFFVVRHFVNGQNRYYMESSFEEDGNGGSEDGSTYNYLADESRPGGPLGTDGSFSSSTHYETD